MRIMRAERLTVLLFCLLGLACGTDDRDPLHLKDLVEDAAGRLQSSTTFEEALELFAEFRDVGGEWNDGSTYLILLTHRGGVYIHSANRELEDQNWSNLEDAAGKNVGELFLAAHQGDFVRYEMTDGTSAKAYAFPFSAPSIPLTNPLNPEAQQFVLVGGFRYEPPVKQDINETFAGFDLGSWVRPTSSRGRC